MYYGNTKEDAADIGFRDDFIYDYINKLTTGSDDVSVLDLSALDREETIKTFKDFKYKKDKTIY